MGLKIRRVYKQILNLYFKRKTFNQIYNSRLIIISISSQSMFYKIHSQYNYGLIDQKIEFYLFIEANFTFECKTT
jgi:hypothetical protein